MSLHDHAAKVERLTLIAIGTWPKTNQAKLALRSLCDTLALTAATKLSSLLTCHPYWCHNSQQWIFSNLLYSKRWTYTRLQICAKSRETPCRNMPEQITANHPGSANSIHHKSGTSRVTDHKETGVCPKLVGNEGAAPKVSLRHGNRHSTQQ